VKRLGRSTQGVIVMRLREGEQVSSLAPVVESGEEPDDSANGLAADGSANGSVVEPAAGEAVSDAAEHDD
jgi:hypothetical protein